MLTSSPPAGVCPKRYAVSGLWNITKTD
jgi:hypothetical protein